jgi:GDP-L-fucose synthase
MKKDKIYIAGHTGMVGSAILNFLKKKNVNLITRSHKELDLTNQADVKNFFKIEKPDQVYLAAAKVGGINANVTKPAEFIYENLMIQANIIHASFENKVKKLLFISSSCVYSKFSDQPIKEDSLLCNYLEKTVESYAVAKIAGMKMCEAYNKQYFNKFSTDYRIIIPNNLFGPGDSYDHENSHVVAALIRKFHEAKIKQKSKVILWGSGKPLREFLYLDDFVQSCIFLMNIDRKFLKKKNLGLNYFNVGSGREISILKLAKMIKKIVNYKGTISLDNGKPDGVLRKFLDSNKIRSLGWKPKVSILNGLKKTYKNFKDKSVL